MALSSSITPPILSTPETEVSPTNPPSIQTLIDFAYNLAKLLQSANDSDYKCFKKDLSIASFSEFLSNINPATLFVVKLQNQNQNFEIMTSLRLLKDSVSTIVLIKERGPLIDTIPLDSQIQVINLPGQFYENSDLENSNEEILGDSKKSYEMLKTLVTMGIFPYFDALTQLNNDKLLINNVDDNNNNNNAIVNTRKKFSELALSLQHILQSVQIPDLKMTVHPIVRQAVEMAEKDNFKEDPIEFIPKDLLNDTSFLNKLQEIANNWVRSAQEISKLVKDNVEERVMNEINFWESLEEALLSIQEQLSSKEIATTLNVLKQAKRFVATVSFISDTGLIEALTTVNMHNQLLKDLPISEILSASSFQDLENGITLVMNHMKKLRVVSYPITRAITLVESVSFEVDLKMKHLIRSQSSLISIDYETFVKKMKEINMVYLTFDKQIKEFTNLAREILRRSKSFLFIKINSKTLVFQQTLEYFHSFRSKHQEMINALMEIIGSSNNGQEYLLFSSLQAVQELNNNNLIDEMEHAYDAIIDVDLADTSVDGKKKWDLAERNYNLRTQKVESVISTMLRSILSKATTTSELYLIFKKFNFLLSKSSINASIDEYQTKLLDIAKSDLSNLQKHFLRQSQSRELLANKDIHKVSSLIIWAKQVDSRLSTLLNRLETILGPNWKEYADGQKIYSESIVFQKKLNVELIFDNWIKETSASAILESANSPILQVMKNDNNESTVVVNFNSEWTMLFKEVRIFCYHNFPVPHQIISTSRTIRKVYPFVISLQESLMVFFNSLHHFDQLNDLQVLLVDDKILVFEYIKVCFSLSWMTLVKTRDIQKLTVSINSEKNNNSNCSTTDSQTDDIDEKSLKLLTDLENGITIFAQKIDAIKVYKNKFSKLLLELTVCELNFDLIDNIMKLIQQLINDIILDNYGNVNILVSRINKKVKEILIQRLTDKLNELNDNSIVEFLPQTKHEIILRNQIISVAPAIESVREIWIKELQKIVNSVRNQKEITYKNFDVDQEKSSTLKSYFSDINLAIEKPLEKTLLLIETHYQECEKYVNKWYQFQSLWDLQVEKLFEKLGKNVELWIEALNDIKKSRRVFDTFETSKTIGSVIFNYEQIQLRVNAKFDTWQKDFLINFAEILGDSMREMESDIVTAIKFLEENNVNASSTGDVVQLITNVHGYTDSLQHWNNLLNSFERGQSLMIRNRYPFPSDWLHVEQISNDYARMNVILSKRLEQIEVDHSVIVKRFEGEFVKLSNQLKDLKVEWTQKKPVSGSLVPQVALSLLKSFEQRVESVQNTKHLLEKASEILVLPFLLSSSEDLSSTAEEIVDYKSVWSSIEILYNSLQDIRFTSWNDVSSRVIRKQLDELIINARSMPSKVRQYSAFDYIMNSIKQLLKENSLLTQLKSESLKERHWRELFDKLNKPLVPLHKLQLGDVWDLNLLLNEVTIKELITKANGERVLEDSLNKIEKVWGDATLELFNYQNKFRLVKGWDNLFKQCSDDIDLLGAMHNSTFFPTFEQETVAWETKLNKLYILLDVWIDVQRQWMYLDGIFGENKDIKRLLPVESSRFQNITNDFFRTLKIIYKSPFVINVITIPDVQTTMERTLEVLGRVKKALGDYLERQRELFPRFYFIGNDDLLNIIGNSDDPKYIGNYLNKIYSNIHAIEFDGTEITAIVSKENEIVKLNKPIVVANSSSLVDWLKELELEIKDSLSLQTKDATDNFVKFIQDGNLSESVFLNWLESFSGQACLLAIRICWTRIVEDAIKKADYMELENSYEILLSLVSSIVLGELSNITRKKIELLIIELIYQQNVILELESANINSLNDFTWKSKLKYYLNENSMDYFEVVKIRFIDQDYHYGFEYQGLTPSLVRNKIVEKSFIHFNETLAFKKGSCSFGPAGTGKTESVKEFGKSLGRPVLVFNCDESFDFAAISRILLGICQVGASVCFDEFNRLESQMLSAVSSQLEKIELGLSNNNNVIDLLGVSTKLHKDTSIFITMNPGYAGRSSLPENLKKLFRNISVSKTDKEAITEVILLSQGFSSAKQLSGKVIELFNSLFAKLTNQIHYDFGLRAIKSTLGYCGKLKRALLSESETQIILQGINSSISPKLLPDDIEIFNELCSSVFNESAKIANNSDLVSSIEVAMLDNGLPSNAQFIQKVLQLHQLSNNHHGIMMVGESGSSKSTTRKILFQALHHKDGIENVVYTINPKISKAALYGSLDLSTREFKDGLFTSILRRIVSNLRGELSKRNWIVFDGDVDPEWIENLNSLLDDNKIFTLPNGEHIGLPDSVKIIFETESLKHATPATVSRCGMIWFSNIIVSYEDALNYQINKFKQIPLDFDAELNNNEEVKKLKDIFVNTITKELLESEIFGEMINYSLTLNHCFQSNTNGKIDLLMSLYMSYFKKLVISYGENSNLFDKDVISSYSFKSLILSVFWSLGSDCPSENFSSLNDFVCDLFSIEATLDLHDQFIQLPESSWSSWSTVVPRAIVGYKAVNEQLIIPTPDTIRLESFIDSFTEQDKFLILCGPAGSGKTMTVLSYLRASNIDLISINFSTKSCIKDLLSALHQYCQYVKTSTGTTLKPKSNKKLVCFIDEINLPELDNFGSQPIISFLREIAQSGGFYSKENHFVKVEDVKFVGACNPSSDIGRNEMSNRFLRLCPVIYVDYPSHDSLITIYKTFANPIFTEHRDLYPIKNLIVELMIDIYFQLKAKLSVLSPRDLTRLVRSLFFGLENTANKNSGISVNDFLRLFVNESLRLFSDRLSNSETKVWIFNQLKMKVKEYLPSQDYDYIFQQPIIYSKWLSASYSPVDINEYRSFVNERLKVFSTEVLDSNLILYQDCLDHIARLDRVLSLPQGHLILVGDSTSGKTTLSRFVAWVNGLSVIQLAVHRKFGLEDFDNVLKDILKRSGAQGEKICFIIDESNILETAFIERMNTLLANSEIPSLFNGNEFGDLISTLQNQSQQLGLLLDTEDELYSWFTDQISQNLHVVFTINSQNDSMGGKILSSPALINRCVVNWMGDWTNETLYELAFDSIRNISVDTKKLIIQSMIDVHRINSDKNLPGQFMDLLTSFMSLLEKKELELEDQQRHINIGLDKFKQTVLQVKDLKDELSSQQKFLQQKNIEAKEMLNKMLYDQNECERKQEASVEVKEALKIQEAEINHRKTLVSENLETMIPIIEAAAQNVKNIKKQNLSELRSMNNPPEAVKMTLEAVCALLGFGKKTSWREIQAITRRDDFVLSILNFENNINPNLRNYLEEVYLSNPNFKFETVNRASKACGPLLSWIEAQLRYSAVLEQVDPLQQEVYDLENSARENKAKLLAITDMLEELEEKIEQYKLEYSMLIRETENIKLEMSSVENKVDRSVKLMGDLTQERERWSKVSFSTKKLVLPGNCLLSAAFMTYSGYYDQKLRNQFMRSCKNILNDKTIMYDEDILVDEFLSSPGEILNWQSKGLLNDSLFIENMILIKYGEKYPFIIDPNGEIIDVLKNIVAPKKLVVTSFLDKGFIKQIEHALRFGTAILVEDAEYYDPILSSILKNEITNTGGRMLTKLGNQEIDCSPNFKIYLHTKNPDISIPSHIFGRTTVVNYTTTRNSLESKVLNLSLLVKEPEIETKRQNLIKLNDEYKANLRKLEEELLICLGDSSGNILDNEILSTTLERIKSEAKEIEVKMDESRNVMKTIDEISDKYYPLANHCSSIFNILNSMSSVNKLYQFSLEYFFQIFDKVLKIPNDETDIAEFFIKEVYKNVYSRVLLSLKENDKSIFGLGLCFTYINIKFELGPLLKSLFGYIKSQESIDSVLIKIGFDENLVSKLMEQPNKSSLKELLTTKNYSSLLPIFELILEQTLNPINFNQKILSICEELFDIKESLNLDDGLKDTLFNVSTNLKPIILSSPENFDPTSKIESIAKDSTISTETVAMGSSEAVEILNKVIRKSSITGSWVIVQNCQMANDWLNSLSKSLVGMTNINKNFRLILTCYANSSIPVTLLRSSYLITFEEIKGLRNSFVESIKVFNNDKKEIFLKNPVERKYIYFLLIWYHSIITERSRYIPIGWGKNHDFSNTDLEASIFIIDRIFNSWNRNNISPELIPWKEINYLIGELSYGSKIDIDTDFNELSKITSHLFNVRSFDSNFNLLVNDQEKLLPPDDRNLEGFKSWIVDNVPIEQSPAWLGLPNDVKTMVDNVKNQEIIDEVINIIDNWTED